MMPVRDAFPGFTFGCDPEVFIVGPDGNFVTAAGLIPGTKAQPYKVPDGAVQVDGMAAEVNIEPASTFSEFNRRIERVLGRLQEMLPEGHTWSAVPSVTFREEDFIKAPDEAKELGCSPDFDAWEGDVNPVPEPENPLSRCAGGHLHVGWRSDGDIDAEHIENCRDLCKQFDWHLAHWAMRIDTDQERRKMYGKAGAHRIKPYGVEYRTLSNFWIVSRDRRLAVWNRMQNALYDMKERFLPEQYARANKTLVESVNTSVRSLILERNYRYPLVNESVLG